VPPAAAAEEPEQAAAATEEEDAAWAAAWEEEQYAAATQAPLLPRARRPPSRAAAAAAASAPRRLAAEREAAEPQPLRRDDKGVERGECGAGCGGCHGFSPFAQGMAISPRLPAAAQLALMRPSPPGSRCGRCGCAAAAHLTPQQAAARRRSEAARCARRDASLRRKEAAAAGLADGAVLTVTGCDAIGGAERGACGSCVDCACFQLWYSSSDAANPEVMLFCSACGCETAAHPISSKWAQQQQKEREAEAERRRRRVAEEEAAAARARGGGAGVRARHLATLGLSPDASMAKASAAFRRLALQLHPDKQRQNPQLREDAAAQFVRVTEAWRGLQQA